jgi:hypothetical protein
VQKLTPPKDLQGPGRVLWRSILDEYDLSKPEMALLREASRTADELEVLRSTVLAAEVLITGSTGQPVVNKVYDELRKHREALTRLLAAIDLPVEVVPVVPKLAAAPPGRAVQSSLARARAVR